MSTNEVQKTGVYSTQLAATQPIDLSVKKNRKAAEQELEAKALQAGLSNKAAKKYAQSQVKNIQVAQNVSIHTAYLDKKAYQEATQNDVGAVLVNGRMAKAVEKNQELFYEDGKFSSDKYKKEFENHTGADLRLDLSERRAGASELDMNGSWLRRAGNYITGTRGKAYADAARKMGYEVERDNTLPVRAAAIAGVVGTAGLVGALTPGWQLTVNSLQSVTTNTFLDGVLVDHFEKNQSSSEKYTGGKGANVGNAMAAALPGAILGSLLYQDSGDKDIFKGNSCQSVIDSKNLYQVKGDINKGIVTAMQKIDWLSREDKIAILEESIGAKNGGRATRRELVAALEAMLNKEPKAPVEEIKPVEEPAKVEEPGKVEEPETADIPDPAKLIPGEHTEVVKEKEPFEVYDFKYGDTLYEVLKGFYGITNPKDLNKAIGEIKKLNGITDRTKAIYLSQYKLPNNLAIGDGYQLDMTRDKKMVKPNEGGIYQKRDYQPEFKEVDKTVYDYRHEAAPEKPLYSNPIEHVRDSVMNVRQEEIINRHKEEYPNWNKK